jgi:hypothetical protein
MPCPALDEPSAFLHGLRGRRSERETGWSVQVIGQAQWVKDPEQLRRLGELPLVPWAHGEKSNFIRIIPRVVTGRRIHPPGVRCGPKA